MSEKPEMKENETVEAEKTTVSSGKTEKNIKVKKKGRKKKIIKRVIWTVILLLIVGVALWSVYSKLRSDYKITYDPYTATTGSISNSLSFTGSVQLIHSAAYTAEEDTKVRELFVAAGDKVKKGDKLIRLSNGTTIEAEFNGTVSAVEVAKDDDVKNGASLLSVADFDHMQVTVRVGESNISEVSVGQACKVTVSSANASFESTIGAIDYSTYTGNNVAYYTAKVDLDASSTENIWPGMQATVTITLDEAQNVTVLKLDALSTARDNTAFVYKEKADGEMEEVAVTVGVSNGNYVEIKSGVTAGETVYKIAEKKEELTGLAALFSGAFTNRQVNRQQNRNWQNRNGDSGDMPDFSNMPGGGSFPGGGSGGFPGGGSGGSRGN